MSDSTIKQIATVFSVDDKVIISGSKPQRRRSIIKEFGLNTSTHGIPGIARSQSIHNRIFWSIALLIFIGVMLYFIITSILAYFQYPTQTSIDIVVEWPQAFPAVTICNYSPWFYSRFIGPFLNYTNTLNLTNTTDTTRFSQQQASYVPNFLRDILDRGDTLSEYSFPLESMLMSCSYNNLPCSAADFTPFESLRYGTCFTFNGKTNNTNDSDIRYNSDNGGDGTLELTFYIHRLQYVPYVTTAVGMMAMVHDNDEFPLVVFSGMQLTAGRNHKLGYIKQTNLFLPSPYTSCTDHVSPAMQTMFDRYQGNNYAYTQYICYTICMQKSVYQKCGCVGPNNWATRFIVLSGSDQVITAPLCNWTDPCYSRATVDFANAGSLRDVECPECGQECTSNTFNIKSSSLSAPMGFQLANIKQFVESSSVSLPTNWQTIWPTEIPANYISLEVVCETTQTEIFTQQASTSAVDLISNIGGQTGLWIGISFLSLLEIIEMLYRLIRSQYHRFGNAVRRRRN